MGTLKVTILLATCIIALTNASVIKEVNDDTKEINNDPSLAPEICARTDSDGVLVAHEHCTRFYKCFDGAPVALVCPSSLLYNPATKECDWPYEVDCGDRIIPEEDEDDNTEGGENESKPGPGNDDPSLAPKICAEKDSNGVLVAHENCNKFYNCFDSYPVPLKCPSHLLFNPVNGWCDFPENVNCGDRFIPEDDGSDDGGNDSGNGGEDNEGENLGPGHSDPSLAPEICNERDSDGVLVAHEHCTRFYKCFDGQPVPKICPSDLLYNPQNQQCDWPRNVECGDRIIPEVEDSEDDNTDEENENDNTGPGNYDPSLAPKICAEKDSNGVLVAHENCNRFYNCFDGIPVALRCPSHLLFNPQNGWCDFPRNVECGDRVITEDDDEEKDNENGSNENESVTLGPGHADPSEAPEICAQEESEGVLVAHEHCTRFYKCHNRRPVPKVCPSNLLYNHKVQQCDWPRNVECGDRIIPEEEEADNEDTADTDGNESEDNAVNGHCDPSEAPKLCAQTGSDSVLVAHENCNQFYVCWNSQPSVLTCPPTLLYNPTTEQCDWAQQVQCGSRVIPEE